MAEAPPLTCIWNSFNQHLENATTDPKYRRCRKPATAVIEGFSFCEEHLAAHYAVKREQWELRLQRPY
jgi:hypothetical protein